MRDNDLEIRVSKLVKLCEKAPLDERLNLRPEVDRVIRTLTSYHLAVPRTLRRLKDSLEEEAQDDMFDNMPV